MIARNSSAGAALHYSQQVGGRRVQSAVFGKSEAELLAPDRATGSDGTDGTGVVLSDEELRAAEKEFLARYFEIPAGRVTLLRQVHGDRVVKIRSTSETISRPASTPVYFDEGDAMFTSEPGVLLAIRTADCLPLFFELSRAAGDERDSGGLIVGIVHAGWRGLAIGIISRALTQALRELRTGSSNRPTGYDEQFQARFWLGPCIGADAYEVGEEVARKFKHATAIPGSDKFLLDLAANARLEIQRALAQHAREFELDSAKLDRACTTFTDFEDCTSRSNDRWFSHRRGDRGRNLNTILIGE